MAKAKILLICAGGRHEEAIASGVCKPGHLLKLDSAAKVLVHGSQGGFGERLFATEDALQGKTVDDSFGIGDLVPYRVAAPGEVLYAWIKAGETIVIGDQLISGGDGTLIKTTGTPTQIMAVALEAIDLSDTGDVATRIAVRIV